jgi:hypothetical protein
LIKKILWLLVSLIVCPVSVVSEPLLIDGFSSVKLDGWKIRSFDGDTRYQVVDLDGRPVLKAETFKSASALYRKVDVDLRKTPYLNWSWRVENIHAIDDQRVKAGDDFPARVYVVVKTGFFPWQTRALNYVWSNTVVDKQPWPNPFTANAIMIPLRFGPAGAGQWHRERVNVREDYFRQFNQWIDHIDGIAIMSDSDNARGSATAYYGAISFSQ